MELTVNLGSRSYPIILDQNVASVFPEKLKSLFPESRFGLVTNATIHKLYRKQIEKWKRELSLTIHIMPDGERYKTIETWSKILDTFLKAKFERSSVIIALGGGVVGDVAGFAAATMLRGVAYVQVPTTLLAMVDSSMGGKTGFDHKLGKNLIGAFHQPSLVWIDTAFLGTLPKREFFAGSAELFKYAFIGGRDMFDFVAINSRKLLEKSATVLIEGIKRSIKIKAGIVEQDERETTGKRMLLNFGHTFAHTLEKCSNFKKLLHGEAVWWGIACACELGKTLKMIPKSDIAAYDALLAAMPRPKMPSGLFVNDLYQAMFFDKKVIGGKTRFVVPAEAGSSLIKTDISVETVYKVFGAVFSKLR